MFERSAETPESPKEPPFISEESFAEQFAEDILLKNENGEVMYTKITPETIKFDSPLLYIGGFSQGKETYLGEIKDLAESGREVFFANPIKGFDVSEVDSYNEFKERYKLPDVVLSKMAAIEEVMREEEIFNAELAGHSQGGLVSALLCAKDPTLAHDLVLQSPAGFVPGEPTSQLATKFGEQLASNITREKNDSLKTSMKRAGKSFFKEATRSESSDSMLDTIKWRLRVEVPGMSAVDLAPVLRDIKQTTKESEESDTRISLVLANDDKLFKPEAYEDLDDDYVDRVVFYLDKNASHTAAGIEAEGLLRQLLE